MKQDLLTIYNEELSYLNKMCLEFSKRHPRIASNLNLGPKHQTDPLINHLIESFSFISANIRKQLQDDNEDLAQMLMQRTFPQYLKALPSASIAKINLNSNTSEIITIQKCTTIASDYANSSLLFNTVYNTEMLPLDIKQISYNRNLEKNNNKNSSLKQQGYIDISFTLHKDVDLDNIDISNIRLHINTDTQYTPRIYELLLNKFNHACIIDGENSAHELKKFSIEPVGLTEDESLIPYPNSNSSSYELIGEYFIFPLKYQFINLIIGEKHKFMQHEFKLRLFIDEYDHDLAKQFDSTSLLLNCTPIINLYKTNAEPIYYNTEEHEFLIKINPYMQANFNSVYSIIHVKLIFEDNTSITLLPFSHESTESEHQIYWHERRDIADDEILNDNGRQNVYICLIDQTGELAEIDNATIHIEVLATNHKIPAKLLIDETELNFWEEHTNEVCDIELLHAFSLPKFMNEQKSNQWKLISHLNHNQISLSTSDNNKSWLKEVLSLYNNLQSNESNNILNTIDSINCKTINKRHPDSPVLGYCQGTLIKIHINDDHLEYNEIYLFISILATHFQKCCFINSFIEVKILNEKDITLAYWPAKVGSKQWI